jgi:putative GTP pyrophosphokinase
MEYISGLQSFLAEYEQYEKQVLKPTYDEILKLLNSWENPEYWEKYTVNKGVATPSPIRMTLVRIKHPEKVVDKIFRKPDLFPEGLSSQSIHQMEDTIGIRVIVYFVSQLPLIDKELRSSGLFEVSEKTPPEAYLSPDLLTRFGLAHIKQKNKESGYASIHYTVRLKNSSLAVQERPCFEIQIRTMAQELWSELEHVLAYKPENRPHFSVKRRLQILSREMSAIDEQFNLLYEELIHNQETASYQDSDLLNFENLPKVLMEVGVKCALRDLNPILKLLTSRGVDTVKDLLLIATPRRLETIRNTYISSLGYTPDVLEISAALAALKGATTQNNEIERIKSQIDYQQSDIFLGIVQK